MLFAIKERKKRAFAYFILAFLAVTIILPNSANGEIQVNSLAKVSVNSSLTAPAVQIQGSGYASSVGYISFSGIGTTNLALSLSSTLLTVDLLNIIEIMPSQSGTIFFEYNLPVGVTMYLNSVVISALIVTLTLSGTAMPGTGSLSTYGGVHVTSGTPLYLSFVMNGNAAATGYVNLDFSPD